MRWRDTQLRPSLSAHTRIGGRITKAQTNATKTFMPTMIPNPRSSGHGDEAMTATPAMAVSPETMNARPVRLAVSCMDSTGPRRRARSSTNRNRIKEVNSVHTATTNGPDTAVIGLSLRLNAQAKSETVPTATTTGIKDRIERTRLRRRTARKRPTKMIDR